MLHKILAVFCLSAFVAADVRARDFSVRSDDNSYQQLTETLVSLQTKLQSFQNDIQSKMHSFQNDVTGVTGSLANLQTKLNRLQNDVTHTKYNAAFSVRTSNNGHLINIGQNAAIRFTSVVTNIGNGYSTLNGHFTAPYSGVYMFFFSMRANWENSQSSWIHVGIYKNQDLLALANGDIHYSGQKGVALVITHLNVGDAVYCRRYEGSSIIEDGQFTTFSGFLITPD